MTTTTSETLPATLRLGSVDLTVADLDPAVAWYQRALGLRVHSHEATSAALGEGNETVVVLHEDPAARPPGRSAGLYHFPLLYPDRQEPARPGGALGGNAAENQGPLDHRTHEAIY